MEEKKGNRTISKKRYYEFEKKLKESITNDTYVQQVLATLREVFQFDPDINTYDQIKTKLEKQKEDGISTYQALNRRKYYNANKEVLNKKRCEMIKNKKPS